jgi:hypothetical protein
MPHSFISVDERMVENEREAEGCGFGWKIRIEVIPSETLAWLSQGGLKDVKVSNSTRATPPFYDRLVKLQHLSNSEISSHARRR